MMHPAAMTSEARVANYLRYLPEDVLKDKREAQVVGGAVAEKLLADQNANIPTFLTLRFASNQRLNRMRNFLEGMGTALHWAVRMQDPSMVSNILTTGAVDVNAVDKQYGCTALHTAVRGENIGVIRALLATGTVDVNAVDVNLGLTALHMGVETRNIHVVRVLLEHKDRLRLTEECNGGQTPLEYAHKLRLTDIQRALMECEPVHRYMEELYRDRQVYVDAANAILVGAALIASVTFVSWSQPPLGYAAGYVHVECNRGLKAFWVANSLSFYAAIATVVFGARSVLPRRKFFIKRAVERLQVNLLVTTILLAFSVFFAIVAFAIAGSIVLTPMLKAQENMIVTSSIGGALCLVSLVLLFGSIWRDHDLFGKYFS